MTTNRNMFGQHYGPWALVTGASDGIGAAFAHALAAKGLNLVLVARREERLAALATQLQIAFAIQVRVLPLDLARPASAQALFSGTADLDIGLLVAAAGFGASGPLLQSEAGIEAGMVEVNCAAVLQQCLHYGRRLADRRRGGLVLLSSVLAFQGTPYAASYAASKAYIQALAEGLGQEIQGAGVDVLAVAPGPVASGFAARARMRLGQTMTPQTIAQVSLAALGKQRTVRPGWLSKLLGWGLCTAPRFLRVRIIGTIMQGMTKHQGFARPSTNVRNTAQECQHPAPPPPT